MYQSLNELPSVFPQSKTPLVTAQLYPLTDHQETCKILSNETRGVRVKNFTCQRWVSVGRDGLHHECI